MGTAGRSLEHRRFVASSDSAVPIVVANQDWNRYICLYRECDEWFAGELRLSAASEGWEVGEEAGEEAEEVQTGCAASEARRCERAASGARDDARGG
jgi:hypothetical protein